MKTVTLAQYLHPGPSWAQPDCDHQPDRWRTDTTHPLTAPGFRYVAECRVCGKTLRAEGTAWGRIIRLLPQPAKIVV
jgi:hypothetical protein